MITPTLRQLDIFAQMIASGTIADCARDLALSPAEVEQEIAALEGRLGHRLFDRKGGVATLTDAGRKTVEAMQHLSEIAPDEWQDSAPPEPVGQDEAEQETDAGSPFSPRPLAVAPLPQMPRVAPRIMAARDSITIAAHPAVFSHFQDALSAFEQTNSDVAITLDLDTHSAAQAIPALANGRADIAYFYTLGEPEGWPSRYAWSEQLSLYIGAAHPLATQELVDHADLARVAPVRLLPGNSLRPLIDDALEIAGIGQGAPPPALETDNLYDIMVAVRDGAGYFAAFGPLARDFARMNGIRRLPLAFALPAIDVRQGISGAVEDESIAAVLSEYLFR